MSYCQENIPIACNIDRCFNVLVLGEVFYPNEAYTIHIQNLQTGNYYREDIYSDDDGALAMYRGEYEFMEGFLYEIHVTEQGGCELVDIITKGGEYKQVRFEVNKGCYKQDYYLLIQYINL